MVVYKGGISKPGIRRVPCNIRTVDDLIKAEDDGLTVFAENGTDLNQWKYVVMVCLDSKDRKYIIRMLEGEFDGECFYQEIDLEKASKEIW